MLLLYAYGASFGSTMTTIDVYLVAIPFHIALHLSLYIDFSSFSL